MLGVQVADNGPGCRVSVGAIAIGAVRLDRVNFVGEPRGSVSGRGSGSTGFTVQRSAAKTR